MMVVLFGFAKAEKSVILVLQHLACSKIIAGCWIGVDFAEGIFHISIHQTSYD